MRDSDKNVLLDALNAQSGVIDELGFVFESDYDYTETVTWGTASGGNIVASDIQLDFTTSGSIQNIHLLSSQFKDGGSYPDTNDYFEKLDNTVITYENGDILRVNDLTLTISE